MPNSNRSKLTNSKTTTSIPVWADPLSHYAGIIVDFRCDPWDMNRLCTAICCACEKYLAFCEIACHTSRQPGCVIFYLNFREYNMRVLADSLKQHLYNTWKDSFINIFYTSSLDTPEEMCEQIDFLRQNLHYSLVYGFWKRLSHDRIKAAEQSDAVLDPDASASLGEFLRQKDYDMLVQYLEQHAGKAVPAQFNPHSQCYSAHTLYLYMETVFYTLKLFFRSNKWNSPLNEYTLPELLRVHPGIREFTQFLSACVIEYQSAHEQTASSHNKQFMVMLQLYIEQNLATVTLGSMAEHFHITSAYLSRAFKKNMGQNFSDYLSDRKLQKAAALLRQKISIGDISRQLGYSTPTYFLSKFKEKYGVTPSIYRKKLLAYETSQTVSNKKGKNSGNQVSADQT